MEIAPFSIPLPSPRPKHDIAEEPLRRALQRIGHLPRRRSLTSSSSSFAGMSVRVRRIERHGEMFRVGQGRTGEGEADVRRDVGPPSFPAVRVGVPARGWGWVGVGRRGRRWERGGRGVGPFSGKPGFDHGSADVGGRKKGKRSEEERGGETGCRTYGSRGKRTTLSKERREQRKSARCPDE